MYALIAALLLTNSYDMIDGRVCVSSYDMIGNIQKVEESDEESNPNLVVAYVDILDTNSILSIHKASNQIEGLQFSIRSSDRIPPEGRDYLSRSGKKLPLLHYHTDSGWKFTSGWKSGFDFAQLWVSGNSGKELQAKNQDIPIRQSQARSQNKSIGYPIRGSWWTGCSDWRHLTQGEHKGKFDTNWLKTLSNSEIQSLHSDDHEHQVKWAYVNKASATSQKASSHFQVRRGSFYCPTGNCPWN